MQFLLYSLLGSLGMMLDLVIFYSLVEFGLAYQIANFIGYASGTLLSFGLQRKFTFRIKDRTIFRLILFFIIAGIGYLFSALLLWVFVELNSFDINFSKILTLPIVVFLQYFLNRSISFSNRFF